VLLFALDAVPDRTSPACAYWPPLSSQGWHTPRPFKRCTNVADDILLAIVQGDEFHARHRLSPPPRCLGGGDRTAEASNQSTRRPPPGGNTMPTYLVTVHVPSRRVLQRPRGKRAIASVMALPIIVNDDLWDRRSRAIYNASSAGSASPRSVPRIGSLSCRERHSRKTAALRSLIFGDQIAWILDRGARCARGREGGALASCTVDSFLIWRLTAAGCTSRDSPRGRTSRLRYRQGRWDETLAPYSSAQERSSGSTRQRGRIWRPPTRLVLADPLRIFESPATSRRRSSDKPLSAAYGKHL